MSTITRHRTISDLLDVKAVLRNSSLVRKWGPAIGTDWTRIRVGLRWAMTDSGGNLVDNPSTRVGICAGTAAPWHNDAEVPTTNFVGVSSSGASATMTRGTGPIRYHIGGSSWPSFFASKRVGTTSTSGGLPGNGNGTRVIGAEPSTGFRTLMILEITKGSPNYSFKTLVRSAQTLIDETKQTLLNTIILSTLAKTGYTLSSAFTLEADESAGAFDAVNLAWPRVDSEIEISDVVVVRME